MKPLHLNLAARPYRDYRPVNIVAAAMFVLTLILAWYNIDTAMRYRVETSSTRAKIADLDAKTAAEREGAEAAQRRLRTFNVAQLDDQTRFINAKLSERAFSWSLLLDELESILSDDVRLSSVSPSFDKNGTILLSLDFESRSASGLEDTMNRMNRDPQFSNTFPSSETMTKAGTWAFQLTTTYRPADPRMAAAGVKR